MSNEDFVKMVRAAWPKLSHGSITYGMEDFSRKLRLLKEKFKVWTHDKSLEMKDKSIHIEEEINHLLLSSSTGLLSMHENNKLLALRNELNILWEHDLSSARLQSKMIWASLGDANTKFFHLVASTRRNQNAIWGLEDEARIMVENDNDLEDLGVRYFKQIFSDDHQTTIEAQLKVIRLFPSYISLEEKESFTSQITLEEVEQALKSFKRDRSSGPDGWLVEFSLDFFDLLGNDLVNLVEISKLEGRVASSLKSTFITLIPKKDKPLSFVDFRPISLCNLVYKLISKVAA